MRLETWRELCTSGGQEALRAAEAMSPREKDFLRHYQALERIYPAELARAALETAILRSEARAKFPFADKLYFTREALEQASNWEVAVYRAGRFRGCARLLDLGCSVGGDTLALAQVAPTVGLDHNPLRLRLASANAQALALGAQAEFLQADLNAA